MFSLTCIGEQGHAQNTKHWEKTLNVEEARSSGKQARKTCPKITQQIKQERK
jgi:hypothetical protein